jgi:hypothetical protein
MKKVSMTKSAFVREHKELVKVLKSKNKSGLKREASEQGKELKKILGKK